MSIQLRPTFSESWYRVKTLRVRLRASAQISRQYYRGERWYVVRDPAGNQFHRLSDPAYRFIGLLDGTRTVEEAWDLCGGQLADDAPTQPEVIQILSHLFSANLIDADVTPDATVLLRRHKKLQSRKLQGRLMNILFPRIPLWDPDRFLKMWLPLVRLMFSRVGAIVWLVVVALAVASVAWRGPELMTAAEKSINLQQGAKWENAVYLYAVFIFVKLIHELGHAFACRRFGGECHEMGIMFLVFIPTPYVDASAAWAFRNKWHRIFVGAAGMIVEIFFAALITIAWSFMSHETLLSQLMFNAMLVASVSTIIFNANPLLRYDGYYILSDWLEIPNLRQKSSEYSLGLIKRHLFRVKQYQPLPPGDQRPWLLTYAVTSSIYRVMVGFAIMMLVYFQIPVLGVLMAVGGVVTWAVVPIYKTFKYLVLEPELHRKRGRAIAISGTFAIAVALLLTVAPFPLNVYATAVMEPVHKRTLRATAGGFVREIGKHESGRELRDGDFVKKGDLLFMLESQELASEIKSLKATIQAWEAEVANAAVNDPTQAQRQINQEGLNAAIKQLAEAEQKFAGLRIVAPFDGQLIAPRIHQMKGMFLSEGTEAAIVADLSRLELVTLLEQRDSEQVLGRIRQGDTPLTEIWPATAIGNRKIFGVPVAEQGAATSGEFPSALLANAGGDIQTDPSDPEGKRPLIEQFEIRIKLPEDSPAHKFTPGQRAYVRFELDKQPLIQQWGRRFWQLIQEQGQMKTLAS